MLNNDEAWKTGQSLDRLPNIKCSKNTESMTINASNTARPLEEMHGATDSIAYVFSCIVTKWYTQKKSSVHWYTEKTLGK